MKLRERQDAVAMALLRTIEALTDREVASKTAPLTLTRLGKIRGELSALGYEIPKPQQLTLGEVIKEQTKRAVAGRDSACVGSISGAVATWVLKHWDDNQPGVKTVRRATRVANPHDSRVLDFVESEVRLYLGDSDF